MERNSIFKLKKRLFYLLGLLVLHRFWN